MIQVNAIGLLPSRNPSVLSRKAKIYKVQLVLDRQEGRSIELGGCFAGILDALYFLHAADAALDLYNRRKDLRNIRLSIDVQDLHGALYGPSNGLAISAGIIGLIENLNLEHMVFTGEVTRKGHVRAVGGLIAKLEACKRKTLVYPKENAVFSIPQKFLRINNLTELRECLLKHTRS